MEGTRLVGAGVLLVLAGFALIVVGGLVGEGGAEAEAGGVVFIGPVPLVFGSDREAALMALASGAVAVAALYLFSKGL
ncbi:MAG: DUF131 domain-containing protein [Candidatus Nanohaloarchaea archaeon]|nr:DUF131 domain-containing protein [Candidatus Nanohaloarchaea archaeon]